MAKPTARVTIDGETIIEAVADALAWGRHGYDPGSPEVVAFVGELDEIIAEWRVERAKHEERLQQARERSRQRQEEKQVPA